MIPARSTSAMRRTAPKAAKLVLARGAHKEIKFSNEGRAAMLAGVEILAKAVSVTLGPKGNALPTEGIATLVPFELTLFPSKVEMSSSSRASAVQKSQKVNLSKPGILSAFLTIFFIYKMV